MASRQDVWQGTLALMVRGTLHVLGPDHGYGIARRTSRSAASSSVSNHGTLYPVLLRLEQEGAIASEWGVSDNNRKARFDRIMKRRLRRLDSERRHAGRTSDVIARFFALMGDET